ncbi:MAG: hypothetical protein K1X75_16435 [Leptospirales bacterium]|nr:hypothetical protein [Leptospirales bacterium]
MEGLHFILRYPERLPRLPALLRLLGLVGLIALPFSSGWRSESGQQQLRLGGGLRIVGNIEERQSYGEAWGYEALDVELQGAAPDLVQILDDELPLRKAPSANAELAREDAVLRYQFALLHEGRGAWKQIELLNGDEGWIYGRCSNDLSQLRGGRLLVRSVDVQSFGPHYQYSWRGVAALPFALLSLCNVVWIPLLPALLLWPCFRLAWLGGVLLNWLHALILQKHNSDLLHFLARCDLFGSKLLLSISGLCGLTPHLDLHSAERARYPFRLYYDVPGDASRLSSFLRLVLPLALLALAYLCTRLSSMLWPAHGELLGKVILIALPALALVVAALCILALWISVAIGGRAWRPAGDALFTLAQIGLALAALIAGLSKAPGSLRAWFSAPTKASGGEAQAEDIDPQNATRMEISLPALWLLLLSTGGLYFFLWLGRTLKILGEDVFGSITIALLGLGLPLSFLLPRCYRRSELLLKSAPGWLFEALLALPGLNVLLGPLIVQHQINYYARLRARSGG